MSERWKPGCDDWYYYIRSKGDVDSVLWCNDAFDHEYYKYGNCFRTKKEATNAAKKVKALLMSLHEEKPVTDCNQLQKLTEDVFLLHTCPEWAKYVTVDLDGEARYHELKPKVGDYWWFSSGNNKSVNYRKFDASDWQNSLIERPAKLPNWCKVGEWCYCHDDDGNPKYFKITDIKDNYIYGEDWDIDYHFVRQARPRPFNTKEMKGLIGKVVGDEHGNLFSVTAFVADDGGAVCVNGVVYKANDLLEVFTIGNEPCARMEHLNEKGEWVE